MRVSVEHDDDTFVRFEKKVCFEIRMGGKFIGFFIIKANKEEALTVLCSFVKCLGS